MIVVIEADRVKRVNVKDMSHLGRDYLQVGMYTEIFFPEHDVHSIAVNDGVDSNQEDNEFTPFRNIINEWYAKDTRKKPGFRKFVDRIIIHVPDKNGDKRLQEIEIIYNHIGVFDRSKVTLWKGNAI